MRHTNLPAQPATEGPDVLYRAETGDWSAFAHGRYVDSFANSQDAWAAARTTVFVPAAPAPISVTVEPHICDDRIDKANFGRHVWTSYETGDDSKGYPVGASFPVEVTHKSNVPTLYAFGESGWPLDRVDEVLPKIVALMNSPEVQAARQRWNALVAARQAEQEHTV